MAGHPLLLRLHLPDVRGRHGVQPALPGLHGGLLTGADRADPGPDAPRPRASEGDIRRADAAPDGGHLLHRDGERAGADLGQSDNRGDDQPRDELPLPTADIAVAGDPGDGPRAGGAVGGDRRRAAAEAAAGGLPAGVGADDEGGDAADGRLGHGHPDARARRRRRAAGGGDHRHRGPDRHRPGGLVLRLGEGRSVPRGRAVAPLAVKPRQQHCEADSEEEGREDRSLQRLDLNLPPVVEAHRDVFGGDQVLPTRVIQGDEATLGKVLIQRLARDAELEDLLGLAQRQGQPGGSPPDALVGKEGAEKARAEVDAENDGSEQPGNDQTSILFVVTHTIPLSADDCQRANPSDSTTESKAGSYRSRSAIFAPHWNATTLLPCGTRYSLRNHSSPFGRLARKATM